jgi:hypothetical protein
MQDQPHNRLHNHQASTSRLSTPSNLDSARSVHYPDAQQQPSNHTRHHQSGEPVTSQRSLLEQARNAWNQMFNQSDQRGDIQVLDANRPIQLSLENLNNNVKWGDELGAKPEDTTRIYVLNVHGLSLDRRGGHFDDLCKVSKEVQADVLCGQEINVDVTQPMVRSIL